MAKLLSWNASLASGNGYGQRALFIYVVEIDSRWGKRDYWLRFCVQVA